MDGKSQDSKAVLLGKHKCSTCGEEYYVNPNTDIEYACPGCGIVEPYRMVGQKSGRSSNIFDD